MGPKLSPEGHQKLQQFWRRKYHQQQHTGFHVTGRCLTRYVVPLQLVNEPDMSDLVKRFGEIQKHGHQIDVNAPYCKTHFVYI